MKMSLKMFAACSIFLTSQFSWAQTNAALNETDLHFYSVENAVDQYPVGSINSQEVATSALSMVITARSNIEARFLADQRICYPKFFTTSCLNKAAERRRVELLMLKPVEIEANSFIRQARVTDRDKRLEEKAAENAGKPMLTEAPSEDKSETAAKSRQAQSNGVSQETARKARADAYADRNKKFAEKQKNMRTNEEAEEQKRAENIKKYDEKVKASQARQKEILDNKADKARTSAQQ